MKESNERVRKKAEITCASQRLFLRRGYDNTSVQDIIDALNIAKGTFYHYFKSKDALLDAIVDQMTAHTVELLQPILKGDTGAIEKLNDAFQSSSHFKIESIDAFLLLIRAQHCHGNLMLRNRIYVVSQKRIGPLMVQAIKQGIEEKVFNTAFPDDIAAMMIAVAEELKETIARLIFDANRQPENAAELIIHKFHFYQHVLERLLDAVSGSLRLCEPKFANLVVQRFSEESLERFDHEQIDNRYLIW